MSMTPEDYLTSRVDDQITWLDNKSGFNQRRYKWLKTFEIVAAATIPFLTGYITDGSQAEAVKMTVGGLGALIAVSSGVAGLCRYHELWIEYRSTAETLRQHKFLYLTQAAPYDGQNAFALLVQNVEATLGNQNSNWAASAKNSPTADAAVPAGKPAAQG